MVGTRHAVSEKQEQSGWGMMQNGKQKEENAPLRTLKPLKDPKAPKDPKDLKDPKHPKHPKILLKERQ